MGLYKGNPTWREDVYQVEVDDPVVGGDVQWRGEEATSGYSNAASQQLADRTTYLKEGLETLERSIRNEVETQESASIKFEGSGIIGDPLRANLKESLDTIAWVRKDNTFTKDNFFRGKTEVENPTSNKGAVNLSTLNTELDKKVDKQAGHGLYPDVDKTKLAGIQAGATKNQTDAYLLSRANHTGAQPISTVSGLQSSLDSKVDKVAGKGLSTEDFTTAEKTKLSGVATGATKNQTDAYLLNRTNHTGSQAISTVSGLQTALDSKVNNTDSRLSDSREWTASTVSQAEAEAGTATTRRAFTAQRVRQAIAAWWLSVSTLFGRSLVEASDASDAKAKLGLSTVATSGSYNDLSNKPTIPTVPALLPQAEATTGTATTQRTINAKVLKDTIDASVSTATNPLQPKLTAGTNVQISADNVISSTNTTYAGMSASEIGAGTSTTTRSISSKVLNDWLNGKGYSTQTLVAGSNVSISGNTISAVNTTYAGMTQAEATAGTVTTQRLISPKVLVDTISSAVSGGVSADALIKAQNLNDLPNKATARTNLGLGSAAVADLGTSVASAARGNHTHAQYWDIVNTTGYAPTGNLDDFSAGQGGYVRSGTTNPNAPETGLDVITKAQFGDPDLLQIAYPQRGVERLLMRTKSSSGWGDWLEFWHDGNFNPNTKANTATQVIAGNGLSGGGNLSANRTLTLGIPSTLTSASTNSVSTTSHTHELGADVKASLDKADSALQVGDFGIGDKSASGGDAFDVLVVERGIRYINTGVPEAGNIVIGGEAGSAGGALYVSRAGEVFGIGRSFSTWGDWRKMWDDSNFSPDSKQDKLTAGTNISISGNIISATNTTYSAMSVAELRTGTATTSRVLTAKNINDFAEFVTLSGTSIIPNLNSGRNFTFTPTANSTINNPTNARSGQTGDIVITSGATAHTIGWGTAWKFANGDYPTLSASSITVVSYKVVDANTIICAWGGDIK